MVKSDLRVRYVIVNSEMISAGLEVFEEYLAWENFPHSNSDLVRAIINAALSKYEEPKKAAKKTEYTSGYVYFLKCNDLIKIGKANDVKKRISSIQTSSPGKLELLGSVKGGIRTERQLHKLFTARRQNGEWFSDCDEIGEYISKNCNASNDNELSTLTRTKSVQRKSRSS